VELTRELSSSEKDIKAIKNTGITLPRKISTEGSEREREQGKGRLTLFCS